jgi:hypothetical protein
VGSRLSDQLDDQARKFLNGPNGVKVEARSGGVVVYTTKVMDWFADDFREWGGGQIGFIIRYVNSDKRKPIETAANQVDLKFHDYDWKLNDNSG